MENFVRNKVSKSDEALLPPYLREKIGTRGGQANCWGVTKSFFTDELDLDWIDEQEMESWLKTYTRSCKRILPRTILVLRNKYSGKLVHTAVFLGKNHYFHKPGAWAYEVTSLQRILSIYQDYNVMYRFMSFSYETKRKRGVK